LNLKQQQQLGFPPNSDFSRGKKLWEWKWNGAKIKGAEEFAVNWEWRGSVETVEMRGQH
jgi:hypothetical protein